MRYEFVLVEGLGHIVVGAEAETLYLVFDAGEAGENQDRGLDLGDPERPQHLVSRHVGEVEVEKNDVVIVKFTEIDTLFAEIGNVDVEAL